MANANPTTAGSAIDALLTRFHQSSPAASTSHAATHRQKFQRAPAAKLRKAVERGINPFRLATDPPAGRSSAQPSTTHARQGKKRRRLPKTERAGAATRKACPRRGTHAAEGTARPSSVGPPSFRTHVARPSTGMVPLAVQAHHRDRGLGEHHSPSQPRPRGAPAATTDTSAPTTAASPTLAATSAHNEREMKAKRKAAVREPRTVVRHCTARHVRGSVAGISLPYRLTHIARMVSLASGHADAVTLHTQDRRRRRLVREAVRCRDPSATDLAGGVTRKTGGERRRQFRVLQTEVVAHADALNWGLVRHILQERHRFLHPLNTRYKSEDIGLLAARSFPLVGALVEVLQVCLNASSARSSTTTAGAARRRAAALIHQQRRRVGLVLAETAKHLMVLLFPSPLDDDASARDAFIQSLLTDDSLSPAPPLRSPLSFEVTKVRKLFPGGSGDLLDVMRQLLHREQCRDGHIRAQLCVVLGEAQSSEGTSSVLSCLNGRCL